MNLPRLSADGPKQARRTNLPGENGKVDDVFSYPTASEISSPIYEGLRTNIPAVGTNGYCHAAAIVWRNPRSQSRSLTLD